MEISRIRKNKTKKAPTLRYSKLTGFAVFLVMSMTYHTTDSIGFGQLSTGSTKGMNGDYEVDSLFIALLTNGDASIDYNLVIKSNKSSTDVTLFGETIQDLSLTDYNETEIKYTPTEIPNKITVYPQSSDDIHLTYSTPDLVDKQNRNWTFSLTFPDKFLLKIPSEAQIINMNTPPFLTPTEDQNLWGFGPGNIQLSYIIGPIGTKQEAQASIRSVEGAIKDTNSNYQGIILNNITNFLEKAKLSFRENKFLETVTYATNAFTLLQNTSQNYILGKNAILQAENELLVKRNSGYDTSLADRSLSMAQSLFLKGEYKNAENVAKQSMSQPIPRSDTFIGSVNSYTSIIIGLLVSAILVIFFIIRYRKTSLGITHMKNKSGDQGNLHEQHESVTSPSNLKKSNHESTAFNFNKTKEPDRSPFSLNEQTSSPQDADELKDSLNPVVEDVENGRKDDHRQRSGIPVTSTASDDDQTDKEFLLQVINRMKSDKPYLRIDDKDLLDYLCEKQGSAFESEIRNKFVLPRTSLWRLIKRLEREELVEVRKIGGQNLIKLRFEDKAS